MSACGIWLLKNCKQSGSEKNFWALQLRQASFKKNAKKQLISLDFPDFKGVSKTLNSHSLTGCVSKGPPDEMNTAFPFVLHLL
jgi:hypothetical protein